MSHSDTIQKFICFKAAYTIATTKKLQKQSKLLPNVKKTPVIIKHTITFPISIIIVYNDY